MPLFFTASLGAIALTLVLNLTLSERWLKRLAFPMRLVQVLPMAFLISFDTRSGRIVGLGQMTLMATVILCGLLLATDGVRYWKKRDDPEVVKSVLESGLGGLAVLLALNAFAVVYGTLNGWT